MYIHYEVSFVMYFSGSIKLMLASRSSVDDANKKRDTTEK